MKIIPPIARAVPTRLGVELEKRCGFFISTLEEQINPNLIEEEGGGGVDRRRKTLFVSPILSKSPRPIGRDVNSEKRD